MAETTHDCGELGGLAQSRKRFPTGRAARRESAPFPYEPEKKSLRAVGDILGRMPLPGDIDAAGPMHRVPSLQWKTWVRLALVRAGSDWRSLNELAVEDGYLRDLIIVPEYRAGYMGVHGWNDSIGHHRRPQQPYERRILCRGSSSTTLCQLEPRPELRRSRLGRIHRHHQRSAVAEPGQILCR